MPGPACMDLLRVRDLDSGGDGIPKMMSLKGLAKTLGSCTGKGGATPGFMKESGKRNEDSGLLKEKKKQRKKKRKKSSSNCEDGKECFMTHIKIVKDVGYSSPFSDDNCRAGPITGEVVELHFQKPLRGEGPGNGAEASVLNATSEHLKLTTKKRKRFEQSSQKATSASVSASVVTMKETLKDNDRVWQYVCKRAVLVDPKGHIKNSLSGMKSLANVPSIGLKPGYGKKTRVSEIAVAGRTIVVTNTKEGAVAQDWILRQEGAVFGLDAEWRPSYTKGSEHKVALLQICGESECLIVQMLYLDVVPWALIDFLKDPNILFPGVGVSGDARKLHKDWGLECKGAVDLTSLAAKTLGRAELKSAGLKALAKVVIGFEMAKPKRVTMSNWAKPVLDKVQVEYASLDAWVSYAIHQKLVKARN